ncbi:MAG TPA: SUMF1/EgtB/PvdO family nonheme iron enzyme [Vicinamibacterales bacterium]
MSAASSLSIDRAEAANRFIRTRGRSRRLFDLLAPDAYYSQPIPLRHPIVFYEGHLSAFSFNTLNKRALGEPGIDAGLERLFARGIDPEQATESSGHPQWPARDEVLAFVDEADRRVLDALLTASIERPGHPLLDRGQAVHAILEHEAMHQETLLYMWHQLPYDQKRPPAGILVNTGGSPRQPETTDVPAGRATIGARSGEIAFGWDNEFEAVEVDVPAFAIDRYDVTNAAFLEFVEAGGYRDSRWWTPDGFAWLRAEGIEYPRFWTEHEGRWWWRGMFQMLPLPASWPVYVSHSEASAYARWRGRRLPTEAEYCRAAFGTPAGVERSYPWGDDPPDAARGHFDFAGWDPQPTGHYPAGQSAWGVDDLLGNGWEWTSTVFAPLPGFTPLPSYPEYSADFFDGQHYVMKGASSATARDLLRPSFRNWFRPHYPYVYAAFRCVSERA